MKAANSLISELLQGSGAVAWGSAECLPVDEDNWHRFQKWIECGYNAGMHYMKNYPEIRRDPRLLLEGAKSIISVAYNYRQPNPVKGLATYALGEDYHKVLRRRLKMVVKILKEKLGGNWRICIDSAPLLERYWAQKCGVGRRSEIHGNIIVEGVGSMVFLAEIITTLQLEPTHENFINSVAAGIPKTVGTLSQAVCPTRALLPGGVVDARRCINYLTIEHQEPLDDEQLKLIGEARFGCEICQKYAVENQGTAPDVLPEFRKLPYIEEFLDGKECGFDLKKSPISRKFR